MSLPCLKFKWVTKVLAAEIAKNPQILTVSSDEILYPLLLVKEA